MVIDTSSDLRPKLDLQSPGIEVAYPCTLDRPGVIRANYREWLVRRASLYTY